MINFFRALLSYPTLDSIDIDGEDRLAVHRKVLENKKMLKDVFIEFHHCFFRLFQKHTGADGVKLEIGAGISPMRNSYPDYLATDIIYDKNLDMVVDAQEMKFKSQELCVIVGQNCFHHIPEPFKFFSEAERVLKVGGLIILLEPYYGPTASFLFPRMFKTEGFDKSAKNWDSLDIGAMNGANQALSYMVFFRDRKKFDQLFPKLKIVDHMICDNYFEYLLSGGLNFKQLIPNFLIPWLKALQKLLRPVNKVFALHHIVVIKKIA